MLTACILLLTVTPAPAQDIATAMSAAVQIAAAAAQSKLPYKIETARGAWFRKVVSPERTEFNGVEGWGVLPVPVFDPEREHRAAEGEAAYVSGPLDRPDIYLGLHADGAEVDAGLIWDHVYDSAAHDTGEFAYRVYWRTKNGGWHNPAVGAADNIYLRPGERFALTLRANADGTARLSVRRAGRRAASAGYSFVVPGLLAADGALKPLSFKRVHSIDQFRLADGRRKGNEGHDALPTRAWLHGGRWEGVHLLTAQGGRRPFAGGLATPSRGVDAMENYAEIFPAAGVGGSGAEEMRITPPLP